MQKLKHFDWVLFSVTMILSITGLVLVYSATFRTSIYQQVNFFERQAMWLCLGLIVMFIISLINYHYWGRIGYCLYTGGILFLLLVLFKGRVISGAKRWLEIRPSTVLPQIGLQPSEFMKIIVVIVLARAAIDNFRRMDSWSTVLKMCFLLLVPVAFVLKQPDLGTGLVSVIVGMGMFYIMGVKLKKISIVILTGILASPLIWLVLKDYQKQRILIFLNPYRDPMGSGYSMIQSRLAIGSGGLLGKGWLQGMQTQLDFVPEHHTDFIFAVLGEEWGYIGCIFALSLYLIMLFRIFHIAFHAMDRFGMFLAGGIGLILAFHVIINVGVVIGLFPITGLPLPFLSYGGSSLVTFLMAMGIVQNINSRRSF